MVNKPTLIFHMEKHNSVVFVDVQPSIHINTEGVGLYKFPSSHSLSSNLWFDA